jgi:hypothetical protein
MSTTRSDVGARSISAKRKHGLRWLPWVALLLALALVALIVLVVTNVNDENDDPGLDVTDDEVVQDSAPATGAVPLA